MDTGHWGVFDRRDEWCQTVVSALSQVPSHSKHYIAHTVFIEPLVFVPMQVNVQNEPPASSH